MTGGYHIVNFKGVNLETSNETGVTITGVYNSIENSYFKSLLFTGVVIDGVEKNSVYATPIITDGNYTISVYGKTITITNTDNVKIA